MSIDSEVSLGAVPMPLQRGASALIRHELKKWLSHKAVAPHAMKIRRSLPPDAAQQYGQDERGGGGGGGGGGDTPPPLAATAAGHSGSYYATSAEALVPSPTADGVSDVGAAPTGGVPDPVSGGGGGAGGGGGGGEASPKADRQKREVSDADLQRAILAALMKHDNPRAGVGRKSGLRSWKK